MSASPQPTPRVAPTPGRAWWLGAPIYQIYPYSFADSNDDGVGDLPGITARLEHVASLGVAAIWLSPFFTSPMKDFGYDIADYRDVDPRFGSLADFDQLIERAHALGLKVIIDQVYSHTSDQHAWFRESRASRDNPHADWYVWADARDDGSPPNNWQSVFGGPAWTWDARRGQYYLHNFLAAQPDLNVHNPRVQDELLECARFWLERGVDGFRLDAVNYAMHDPQLRDNPPAPADGRVRTRPCNFLLADRLTPRLVQHAVDAWPDSEGTGWPSWAFSNHDAPRAPSRWASTPDRAAMARVTMLLLACLRGNIFIYQGEELGLPQAHVPFEQLKDPEAIANWPLTLGRDGARTPIPWRSNMVSSSHAWLPIAAEHLALAVDRQEHDPHSQLAFTRRVLALRTSGSALLTGTMKILEASDAILAFERTTPTQRLLCVFNLGHDARSWRPAEAERWRVIERSDGSSGWALPRLSGWVAEWT
jgi:alpha-glucosidase